MKLVPVLFPCDLGRTTRGTHYTTGERSADMILLDLLEGEGVRLARPIVVAVPEALPPEDPLTPLKQDKPIAAAVRALGEVVGRINAEGHFPVVLGGDQLAMCGQILGHSVRHAEGIGLAILADAWLDLALPAIPVYDELQRLKSDPEVTKDGDAHGMVLSAALRHLSVSTELGAAMAASKVVAAQTSVVGVRGPQTAQVKARAKVTPIEIWTMERLELDGESAYRAVLARHLTQGPIALSIDARGLDPHLMTAVADPVSDGLEWKFLKRSLEQCLPHIDRVLGLDISQVDVRRDDANHTATSRLVEILAPFLQRVSKT